MLVISALEMIFLPIVSIVLLIIGMIYSKKYRMIYMIGIAFLLAVIAYKYNPTFEYDLYKHHLGVDQLRMMNFGSMLQYAISEIEVIKIFIMYIVAKLNNNDILQFLIAFLGYTVIFFMICDYAKRNKIKRCVVLLTTIYIVFSLNYIHFISGLWNYFAMILFSLGIYLEYVVKKHRVFAYLLYAIVPFIHISMLFAIILKILCQMVAKNKINIKSMLIVSIVIIAPSIMISLINKYVNIPVLSYLVKMYESYFVNGSEFDHLHKGKKVIEAVVHVMIYIYAYIIIHKKKEEGIYQISIIYFVTTLLLMSSAGVFIRFIFLGQLIGIPLLMEYFNQASLDKADAIVISCTIIFIVILIIQRVQYITSFDFGNLFTIDGVTSNIVTIFNE